MRPWKVEPHPYAGEMRYRVCRRLFAEHDSIITVQGDYRSSEEAEEACATLNGRESILAGEPT